MFTAGVPFGQKSSDFDKHFPLSVTPSLDYLLQQASGLNTFRFSAGYRSWGAKHNPMSFDNNSTVLPFYNKAYDAYRSIFEALPDAGSSDIAQPDTRESRLMAGIFGYIKRPDDYNLGNLNNDERVKLDRYLAAVADLESKKSPSLVIRGQNGMALV